MGSTVEENEIEYHREIARQAAESLAPVPPEVLRRYRKTANWRLFEKEFIFKWVRDLAEKRQPEPLLVGDFGCGDGSHSCEAALVIDNTKMIGFDLSPDLIQVAQQRAELNNIGDRVEFFVANAENHDPLKGVQVDVMLCLSILHHVELDAVVPNLLSATKPGGVIIIREPIAFSQSLQNLRDKSGVKKDVSPDERQLSKEEIDYLLSLVENPTISYSRLLSRLSVFLPNQNKIDSGHPFTKAMMLFLHWTDYLLLKICPPLKKYCGRVVIIGHRPLSG